MSTVYSGVDFVCIRRASVKQEQSLLGYELLMSKRYPVTLISTCLFVTAYVKTNMSAKFILRYGHSYIYTTSGIYE